MQDYKTLGKKLIVAIWGILACLGLYSLFWYNKSQNFYLCHSLPITHLSIKRILRMQEDFNEKSGGVTDQNIPDEIGVKGGRGAGSIELLQDRSVGHDQGSAASMF